MLNDEVAVKLSAQIDRWQDVIEALRERWEVNGGLYYNDPAVASHFVADGIPPLPVSLWTQKCDRLVGDIVGAITSPSPTVQAIDDGETSTNAPDVETALDSLAYHARWGDTLYQSVWKAANYNVGAHRIIPKADEMGQVVGLRSDSIAAQDFFVYPLNVERIEDLQSVGHRFYMTKDEFAENVKAGLYKVPKNDSVTSGDDEEEYTLEFAGFNLTEGVDDQPATAGDSGIELFDVIYKAKDGLRLCTLARGARVIVRDEDYPYPLPWYSFTRLCKTEQRIISNDSVAWKIQGYTLMHGDLVNALSAGALVTSYGVLTLAGGWQDDMAQEITPGMVMRLTSESKLDAIGIPFNAQNILTSMDKVEQLMDGTIGISNLNSSQPSDTDMTATEANILASADQRRAATYLDAASESVEYDFRLLLMYLKVHYDELKAIYGESVTIDDPEWREKEYRLEVTGMSGASNPQIVMASLMQAREWSMDPRSQVDYGKLEEKALMSLPGLTFDTDTLKKDSITQVVEAAQQLEAQGVNPTEVLALGWIATQQMGGMNALNSPTGEGVSSESGMGDGQAMGGLPPDAGTGGTFPQDGLSGDL